MDKDSLFERCPFKSNVQNCSIDEDPHFEICRCESFLFRLRLIEDECYRSEPDLHHCFSKTEYGFSKKSSPNPTTTSASMKPPENRNNSGSYCENSAFHLPGYVILDDNDYRNELGMILKPRKTRSMEPSIAKQNAPIPELKRSKTWKKMLCRFRKSFIRRRFMCVNILGMPLKYMWW